MSMKAIMYHYVRPHDPEYPNFKHLHIEDFCRQLDYFQQAFDFVEQEAFIQSFVTGQPVPGVILTFDDGFSCHYDYVFQELKNRGLWGIFYLPTQPYVEGSLLDVHRTHLLLGRHEAKTVFYYLKGLVEEFMLDQDRLVEFSQFTYQRQVNDQYTLLVKRILNYYIAYKYRADILRQLMVYFIPHEAEILNNFYLTTSQIKEMHDYGMVIGSHTVHHPVMSRLSPAEQENEIQQSFYYLESVTGGLRQKTFCYPYGGLHSFTNQTEELLHKHNCLFSITAYHRES